MSGPVCPVCGGTFGNCSCYQRRIADRAERRAERAENRAIRRARRGKPTPDPKPQPKPRLYVLERVSQCEAEIRSWAWVVELGLSLIVVGVLILLV